MAGLLLLGPLTERETSDLRGLAQGQKVEARMRDRARICWLSHEGKCVCEIVALAGAGNATVRHWIARFNVQGLAGLVDALRSGRKVRKIFTRTSFLGTRSRPPSDMGSMQRRSRRTSLWPPLLPAMQLLPRRLGCVYVLGLSLLDAPRA